MSSPRIVPRPDITPEQARDIRVGAWRFVFEC